MIIPVDQLDPQVLNNLVEEFITREGTDYGSVEVTLERKVEQVIQQIKSGEVLIVFDELSESCNLILKKDMTEEQ